MAVALKSHVFLLAKHRGRPSVALFPVSSRIQQHFLSVRSNSGGVLVHHDPRWRGTTMVPHIWTGLSSPQERRVCLSLAARSARAE